MVVRSETHDYVTPEDYLAADAKADCKSEYYEGEVFAMVGAPRTHNVIASNIAGQFSTQLRGKPCETYVSDMQVSTARRDKYFYPDITVVCGSPKFEDKEEMTLINPCVVIEILSPSTEAFDRGRKFAAYAEITSLTDYVLVSQDRPRVEHLSHQDDHWIYTAINDLDGVLNLQSIGCNLVLRDIYHRIEFTASGQTQQN